MLTYKLKGKIQKPTSLLSLHNLHQSGKESTGFLLQLTSSVLYFKRKYKYQFLDMLCFHTKRKENTVLRATQRFLTTMSRCTDTKALVLAGFS